MKNIQLQKLKKKKKMRTQRVTEGSQANLIISTALAFSDSDGIYFDVTPNGLFACPGLSKKIRMMLNKRFYPPSLTSMGRRYIKAKMAKGVRFKAALLKVQ
jgi:hypothetical protein